MAVPGSSSESKEVGYKPQNAFEGKNLAIFHPFNVTEGDENARGEAKSTQGVIILKNQAKKRIPLPPKFLI